MKRASAPGYDLFKLVVTLILTAILVLMLLRGCAVTTPPAAPLPTEIVIASTSTLVAIPSATPSPIPPPTETRAAPASPTPSPAPTESPAPTAAPTDSPAPAASAVPAASQGSSACNTIAPSRLSLGQQARVLRNLNMRQQPAINSPIIQTNPSGTILEIVGGPVCTPQGDSAYLWWNVQRVDGSGGWSAEIPLNEAAYFLEPLP